jgi:hypothetical protein
LIYDGRKNNLYDFRILGVNLASFSIFSLVLPV